MQERIGRLSSQFHKLQTANLSKDSDAKPRVYGTNYDRRAANF